MNVLRYCTVTQHFYFSPSLLLSTLNACSLQHSINSYRCSSRVKGWNYESIWMVTVESAGPACNISAGHCHVALKQNTCALLCVKYCMPFVIS